MVRDSKGRLYEELKRRILTLELEPGAYLDETSLSTEFGLSRTPLREIFRRLAGEGYIQIKDNRGTIVSPMSHKTMRDFFLTAPMIYSAIARLAAKNATREQFERLVVAQGRFREAVRSGATEDTIFWNDQFHLIMGEMADNQYLMPSLQRLLIDHARVAQTIWRVISDDNQRRTETEVQQHDAMIATIEARDPEGAAALALDHWALSREYIELFMRPDPLPHEIN